MLTRLREVAWRLSGWLQACYGHTEGTAGITGVLLAAAALQRTAAPGVINLREVRHVKIPLYPLPKAAARQQGDKQEQV